MAIIARDDFNRANSTTTLGTAPTGQVWQKYATQQWGIQTNRAYPVTFSWDDPTFINAGKADNVAYQITIATYHAQSQIMWRIGTTTRNYFVLQGLDVYRVINDNWVSMGRVATYTSGDIVRIELTGNVHKIFIGGVLRLEFTDANLAANTRFGFSANSTTARYDDFLVEDIVVVDTTPPSAVTSFRATATKPTRVSLAWTKPTDTDFSHAILTRNGTAIGGNITTQFYIDSGLQIQTNYTYQMRTVDTSGNIGTAVSLSVTTPNYPSVDTTENFTDDDLEFPVTFSSPYPWYQDTSANGSRAGDNGYFYSSNSGVVNTVSWIEFTIGVPAGLVRSTIEIDWTHRSGRGADQLHISLNGVVHVVQGGFLDQRITNGTSRFDVPAGVHTVRLTNVVAAGSTDSASAQVDQIRLKHQATLPTISRDNITDYLSDPVPKFDVVSNNWVYEPTNRNFDFHSGTGAYRLIPPAGDAANAFSPLIADFFIYVPVGSVKSTLQIDWGLEQNLPAYFAVLVNGVEKHRQSGDYYNKGTWEVMLAVGLNRVRFQHVREGSGGYGIPYVFELRLAHEFENKTGEFRTRTGDHIFIYDLTGDPTQPLRIRTSEGTGYIKLVPVTDPTATRIRHFSSKGLRSWAGASLVSPEEDLVLDGGTFLNSIFARTFMGGGFNTAQFTNVIDGGVW